MFQFWGTNSEEVKALVEAVQVRSTANFNWTFIFILAVVFYVYWSEINKKKAMLVQGSTYFIMSLTTGSSSREVK